MQKMYRIAFECKKTTVLSQLQVRAIWSYYVGHVVLCLLGNKALSCRQSSAGSHRVWSYPSLKFQKCHLISVRSVQTTPLAVPKVSQCVIVICILNVFSFIANAITSRANATLYHCLSQHLKQSHELLIVNEREIQVKA